MSKKYKERFISTLIVALVIFSLLGCGTGSGSKSKFKNPQDLADAYATAITEGYVDDLLSYMPTKMIKTIAKENNVSVQEVKDSLTDWYYEEYEWFYEKYARIYYTWSIVDVQLHEPPEDMIEYMREESLGIAGYRYSGLFKDGAEEIYGCRAIVELNSGYLSDDYWFEFIIVKIDGLWYLVGID